MIITSLDSKEAGWYCARFDRGHAVAEAKMTDETERDP